MEQKYLIKEPAFNMTIFQKFAESFGSYTFRKFGSYTQRENTFVSSNFVVEADGRFTLHVNRGVVMRPDFEVEIEELSEASFIDLEVLEALKDELRMESERLTAALKEDALVAPRKAIEDVLDASKISENLEGATI